MEYRGVNTLAILDSGAGVAIATKKIWESWGRPALQKMRMKLQLADGYIERPIGLLEGIVVTFMRSQVLAHFCSGRLWEKPKLRYKFRMSIYARF